MHIFKILLQLLTFIYCHRRNCKLTGESPLCRCLVRYRNIDTCIITFSQNTDTPWLKAMNIDWNLSVCLSALLHLVPDIFPKKCLSFWRLHTWVKCLYGLKSKGQSLRFYASSSHIRMKRFPDNIFNFFSYKI